MSLLDQAQREWERDSANAQKFDVIRDQGERPKLIACSIHEFLSREIPPRDYLLEPVIPCQGIAMIHGPRGLGKTHVSLGIAYAIASGGTFLKWAAPRPMGVLFVDGEMPARTLQERLGNIINSSDAEATAPLKLVTPDLNIERGMPNLSETVGQAAIDELVDDTIKVIIVDNLSCLARSGVENDAESWLPIQSWALRHRAAGRSVVFIHHSSKNGAQRGTSRREDVLDTVIGLRKPADYVAEQGACFEVHYEKARGFYGDMAKSFSAKLTADEAGKQTWVMRDLEDDRESKIAQMHADGMKPNDIATELGINRSTVYRRLQTKNDAHG